MEQGLPFCVRKSTKIPKYDYSSENYYFVTLCTKDKACVFGTIGQRNRWGNIAYRDMMELQNHYEHITVDNFIVMPNHVHAIIRIDNSQNSATLSNIIGGYKSGVSRKIRKIEPGAEVWQRSFHDHIIRNQRSYEKIWNYVSYNDKKWEDDCFYPTSLKP